MLNICFLVSEGKTKLFLEVSKYLTKNHSVEVFWITPNNRWYKWLVTHDVNQNNILNISKYFSKYKKNKNIKFSEVISNLEKKYKYNFSKLLTYDRILKGKDKNSANLYLITNFIEIEKFLKNKKISFCFSEQTWAFEIITTIVCKKLSITSNYLCNTKFPPDDLNGRFTFFNGYSLDKLPNIKNKNINTDKKFYINLLENYRKSYEPTNYYSTHLNNRILHISNFINIFKHLKYLITDRFDYTKKSFFDLLLYKINILINRFFNFLFKFDNIDKTNINNNFLFCFHRQPDSAIDIIGNKHSNQEEILLNIIKDAPNYIIFNLRFHPHASDQINFFQLKKKFKSFTNVKFLNPKTSINELLLNSNYVFSVAGTVSFEASLLQKNSYMIENLFFTNIVNKYSSTNPIKYRDIYYRNVKTKPNDHRIINFLIDLHERSYPGLLFDPDKSKKYFSKHNIDLINKGFENYLFNQ